MAQSSQSPDVDVIEEVIVTGSRIATRAENAPQPVQVVTSETLALQGVTSVVNALDTVPALLSSTSSAQADGDGASLNLRGMGANRTLVLVDGRRHVAGFAGSAAVDVSTIPAGLIERVEVLTGGASAVYGSDAVTGVVNFILKDDFVGTEFEAQYGISGEDDSEELFASYLYGRNFDNGRGNVTFSAQFSQTEALFYGDRDWAADNRIADDKRNPALNFQPSDPLPAGVSLAEAQGRSILLSDGTPRYAGTDPALIARAQAAPGRAYGEYPTFSIANISGLIGYDPYGFGFAGGPFDFATSPDLDGDGTFDCLQSIGGRGTGGFPVGCWVTDLETGAIRPFRDGLSGAFTEQFGGDGSPQTFSNQSIYPEDTALNFNLRLNYEVSPGFKPYADLKYAYNKGVTYNPYNTFDDSIPIALDNPFIPDAIRAVVDAEIAAGNGDASSLVTIGRDNIDLFDPRATSRRDTYRAVVGFGGELDLGWTYDISVNYGRNEQEFQSAIRLEDRYFAAIDAVIDPVSGDAVCRSTLDPTAFPRYSYLTDTGNFAPGSTIEQFGGFTTFTPGAGSDCRPLNLFGVGAASDEALAFLNYQAISKSTIDQFVVASTLVGDFSQWFSLPGGPVGFATGAEYRRESSAFTPDPYNQLGYGFQYQADAITKGHFDVAEAFLELSFPILADLPFAEILTLNVAGRVGDYSTVGVTETYKVDAIWAPVEDIRFRGGYSVAVRAPNINELFSPLSSAVFRPVDPCDVANIGLGNNPANREANCRIDLGIGGGPYNYVDPLTARFTGQTGGNPNLEEEEAESYTYGVVLKPRFLEGFTATVDYWSIEITNAIAAVGAQDIVNSCYDAPSLDNQFCVLFTRNRNPGSPTFLGFNYLLQTQLNFSSLESSGVDFDLNYRFDLDRVGLGNWGSLRAGVSGTYLEDRNDYPFINDPTLANPVKRELNFPEWAVNASIQWQVQDFTVSWFTNYLDEQTLGSTPIEDVADYTPAYLDEFWSHNASVRWEFNEGYSATFGVNNVTDEKPYFAAVATPVSAIGRFFYFRLTGSY